jgi:hypothetical protein
MKKMIHKILNTFGYDIYRIRNFGSDIKLYYELYEASSVESRRFYNIGSGNFRHMAWTNVDLESDWYKKNQIGIS